MKILQYVGVFLIAVGIVDMSMGLPQYINKYLDIRAKEIDAAYLQAEAQLRDAKNRDYVFCMNSTAFTKAQKKSICYQAEK